MGREEASTCAISTSSEGFLILDFGFLIVNRDLELRIADCEIRIADFELRIADLIHCPRRSSSKLLSRPPFQSAIGNDINRQSAMENWH